MPSKRKLVAAGAICLVVVVAAVTYRTHAGAPMRKAAAALPVAEVDVAAVISKTITDYQTIRAGSKRSTTWIFVRLCPEQSWRSISGTARL